MNEIYQHIQEATQTIMNTIALGTPRHVSDKQILRLCHTILTLIKDCEQLCKCCSDHDQRSIITLGADFCPWCGHRIRKEGTTN